MMNNVDKQYLDLLRTVLKKGRKKADRTGVGTISMFGHQMRFDMREGFPLLTTKKLFTKAIVHELLWFLKGGDNIKYLVDNGVGIWNEWPWQAYMKAHEKLKSKLDEATRNADTTGSAEEVNRIKGMLAEHPPLTLAEFVIRIREDNEFADKWGELGPVYGKQWVSWEGTMGKNNKHITVNQIDLVLKDLATNPDSRRIMVSAWNVSQVPEMKLPPCHWAFQLWTRELASDERDAWYSKNGSHGTGMIKMVDHFHQQYTDVQHDKVVNSHIHDFMDNEGVPKRAVSLMFQMRSVDCFLGMPFDIASYGILLEMIAQVSGMVADELLVTSGDTHIYLNHLEQVEEQLKREPFPLPTIKLNRDVKSIYDFKYEDISFENYKAHPSIKADVAI